MQAHKGVPRLLASLATIEQVRQTWNEAYLINSRLRSDVTRMNPPRNLTPILCKRIESEMLAACRKVALEHGLVLEPLGISNIDLRWGCDVGFRLCIPLPDGTTLDPEQLRFEALAEAFGLSPGDFGREFSTGRDKFKVTGIDLRRPKYPVSAERLPDRQGFKFTAEQVALLLQAGMRDITPKR